MAGSRLETVGSIFSRCVLRAVAGRGCLPRAGALSLGGCEQREAFSGVRCPSRGRPTCALSCSGVVLDDVAPGASCL